MDARYYDPVIGRFYSNDPIGFRDLHSFNRYAYANNNPYKYIDPTGMVTVLVTTRDYGIGSHSAIYTQRGGKTFLYDPAGSYSPTNEVRGSSDIFESTSLADYVSYQESTGSEVSLVTLDTTEKQENNIQSNADKQGGGVPGSCSIDVSSTLKDLGIGTSRLPGNVEDEVKDKLKDKIITEPEEDK